MYRVDFQKILENALFLGRHIKIPEASHGTQRL